MNGLLGDSGAQAVQTMLAGASKPTEGIMAALIGLGALIFAAVGVVISLQGCLEHCREVKEPAESGAWHFIRTYIFSIAAVIAVGFLLLVSLMLTAALAALGKYYSSSVPEGVLQPLGFAVSFLVIAALFAMMFKWLPDADVRWGDVGSALWSRDCCSRSASSSSGCTSASKALNRRSALPHPSSWC